MLMHTLTANVCCVVHTKLPSTLISRSRVPDQKRVEIGGFNTNGQDRWENGDGFARGMVRKNERYHGSVEEVDEIQAGSRKRKCCDSVSALSRLIRSCCRSSNH